MHNLRYWINRIKSNRRNIGHINAMTDKNKENYKEAIKALNNLQSNAEYLKNIRKEKSCHEEEYLRTIVQTQKYLIRSGISLETLDTLPVIHVSGTKGKGSTCALCESILRHHGLRTGFYSSPHLLEVRERIQINGSPITKQVFSEHFWQVYHNLDCQKENSEDMPIYFKFLTILAFRVFLMERVDVAIIEVGIGGEYDCTNILRVVPVAGVTSLGLDHTGVLGGTIEKIAWHKAGIMKPGSRVFTVSQPETALKVLHERSVERQSELHVVKTLNVPLMNGNCYPSSTLSLNSSLATTLAQAWLNYRGLSIDLEATKKGLLNCTWPGRYQVLEQPPNKFYLDGAHTLESMQVCVQWFLNQTISSKRPKVLIFNVTGDRSSEDLMALLKPCRFSKVFFVPNKATCTDTNDTKNFNVAENQQMNRCRKHYSLWMEIKDDGSKEIISVLPTVVDVLNECQVEEHDILVTGSLHLVGAALSVLNSTLNEKSSISLPNMIT